jgi:hypothetical protein
LVSPKQLPSAFFSRLSRAGVEKLIDARLKRDGQLAGFAKAQDLQFFLERLASIEYVAEPLLAPSSEALRMYRKKRCHGTSTPLNIFD